MRLPRRVKGLHRMVQINQVRATKYIMGACTVQIPTDCQEGRLAPQVAARLLCWVDGESGWADVEPNALVPEP
jgi:hypothetical protein